MTNAQRSWIAGLFLLAIAALTVLALLSHDHGSLTILWLGFLRHAVGWGVYIIPLLLGLMGVWVITLGTAHPWRIAWTRSVGVLLLLLTGLSLTSHMLGQSEEAIAVEQGGGYVGYWLNQALSTALGWGGATVALLSILGVGLTLAFDVSLAEVVADFITLVRRGVDWIRAWKVFQKRPPRPKQDSFPPIRSQATVRQQESVPPQRTYPGTEQVPRTGPPISGMPGIEQGTTFQWTLPRIEEVLLESKETQVSLSDIREKTHIIEDTLRSLGVPVTVVEVNPGPVVTQFGLEPGYVERRDRQGKTKRAKVKISRISALSNDLALALAASPVRIEAPVPGKGMVGLEVPNSEAAIVGLRNVLDSEQARALSASRLLVALGRDVSGTAIVDDLAKLPHLLIAGATGAGKSVCINALIACLLCRNTPKDLRLLMVDPKRVELSAYSGIPHLIAPVVVDTGRVVGILQWVTREMERRYKVFAKVSSRNIDAYNELALARGETKMPFIVVFIDELADLMLVTPDEVERLICRIAQMARATGIHLVIATQRPSVDVVTGLIKANFPARLSFAVSSQIDSRVVLDTPGAEKLLGSGDALYMAPDSPKLIRIQGCYVSDAELQRLVSFWKGQLAQSMQEKFLGISPMEETRPWVHGTRSAQVEQRPLWPDMQKPKTSKGGQDPLLEDAISLVVTEQRASVSFLQRRLRIGYTRSARLVDLLEADGIIGPPTGSSKPRTVLLTPEALQERRARTQTL
mgnify:CR=1 FL=1